MCLLWLVMLTYADIWNLLNSFQFISKKFSIFISFSPSFYLFFLISANDAITCLTFYELFSNLVEFYSYCRKNHWLHKHKHHCFRLLCSKFLCLVAPIELVINHLNERIMRLMADRAFLLAILIVSYLSNK